MSLSGGQALDRPAHRRREKAPCLRRRAAKGRQGGTADREDRKAYGMPHAAALVRHTPVGRRLRHPHDSGIARSLGHLDDDDLHARLEQRRQRRKESAGAIRELCANVIGRAGCSDKPGYICRGCGLRSLCGNIGALTKEALREEKAYS